MKKIQILITLLVFACILCACSNIPQAPTKTPTMSPEELEQAARETAESFRRETETQWAIENPSPTPTDTPTPTPEATPTNPAPVIPPTATAEPLPYYRIGDVSYTIYKIGDPGNYTFVPMDRLYIEVCYPNNGSAVWTENYYCQCTRQSGSVISPSGPVSLGKQVHTGEKACFSFNREGSPDTPLGQHFADFQLYSDTGTALSGGYTRVYWNIQ